MSAPRILLHLGLPKTATSSLQHNVFQKLHEEKRINFLGKCLDYDYKTGNVQIVNYTGKFIRDAAEGNLSIDQARLKLEGVLDSVLLNVFSDEGIMVAYPGKENRLLSEKFDNLRRVFEGYNLNVIVTLRHPVDYLYSLYVQLYPDFCSRIKEFNSIEKYTDQLLRDSNGVLFESFFFRRWLPQLEETFNLTVLEYEDFKTDCLKVYTIWGDLLGISGKDFQEYFNYRKLNVKIKSGKEIKKTKDFKFAEEFFRRVLSSSQVVYVSAKWLYSAFGLKAILRYRFNSTATHKYPEGDKYNRLLGVLK